MKLISLVATATLMALGSCAVVVGDPLVGSLMFIAPLAYWAFTLIRDKRSKDKQAFAARLAESQRQHDEYIAKRRVDAEAEYARAVARSQHAQLSQLDAQRQQMQMFAAQQAARDQRAAMARQGPPRSGLSFGYMDPRAAFPAQQAQPQRSSDSGLSDLVNAAALYSLMSNSSSAERAATASPGGPAIVDVPSTSWTPASTDSSSSSSYSSSSSSSDTSSDSFGGSDTSSDSF